jgi:hypothetical protein
VVEEPFARRGAFFVFEFVDYTYYSSEKDSDKSQRLGVEMCNKKGRAISDSAFAPLNFQIPYFRGREPEW